ncbi:cytochrome P450 [Kutzneria sp. CA-103260]|uniref:cytochrome P450 n=1 Tax=Kutzneria sp. CA-103260 TaxID=2802641 RepID=UPI001BA73B99|nr:cytochrome P450 [Kutzneria sp. CA-103260]QUQ62376.1 cytochrome P450 [Kutzneria sp. CA-103260]
MTTTETTTAAELFSRTLRLDSRPNPYPLYEQMLDLPVTEMSDGSWLVSRHADIKRVLHDPRISANRLDPNAPDPGEAKAPASFLVQDAPSHDRLRGLVMKEFVPRVIGMRDHLEELVGKLLDAHLSDGPGQLDIVDDLAYPLPVTVICELLGVPQEDEPIFGEFARKLTRGLDPVEEPDEAEIRELTQVRNALIDYLNGLIVEKTRNPGDDLLSAFMPADPTVDRLGPLDLRATLALLLIAGHETTVNLIANGTLALLRNPDALARLRNEPELATMLVEEVLRYDPPVQMTARSTTADIEIGGVLVPAGSALRVMLAAGNRDTDVFADADQFVPDRPNNAHLGFGGGVHYCVGAMLARAEAQIALTALSRRLDNPRLVADPPPYRENAVLRGPEHLLVSFDRLRK